MPVRVDARSAPLHPAGRPARVLGVVVDREAQLASIRREARRIDELTAAAPDGQVVSCPDWTGRDLRAHVVGFARHVRALLAAAGAEVPAPPPVPADEATTCFDADLAALVDVLAATPARAPAHVWTVTAPVAGFWVRRAVHELAVHRWDAQTIGGGAEPDPIPTEVAVDGIAEFFEEFVTTGLAAGYLPPARCTLVLEITDVDLRREQHLPDPGPVTTIRGSASDLMLALWRRHDLLRFHVGGDPAVLAAWPAI